MTTDAPAVPANTIRITEKAAEKARHFAVRDSLGDDFVLRVAVKGGGCSGLVYQLALAAHPEADDKVIEQLGVRLAINKKSYVFLAGTVLDFSDGLNGKGFVFSNPNAKSTCGCGNSFSV
ncbi:MAG: iron-sulfur cluster assembly accessory protein [Dehalococcoidia bacterium]|nr:iron-sulfur cluster assembly accessory protein [Dehalococcoidia bacterium]